MLDDWILYGYLLIAALSAVNQVAATSDWSVLKEKKKDQKTKENK